MVTLYIIPINISNYQYIVQLYAQNRFQLYLGFFHRVNLQLSPLPTGRTKNCEYLTTTCWHVGPVGIVKG